MNGNELSLDELDKETFNVVRWGRKNETTIYQAAS